MPPLLKLLLSKVYGFPSWRVKPPLLDIDTSLGEVIYSEYQSAAD
jgi:hypothetical protein